MQKLLPALLLAFVGFVPASAAEKYTVKMAKSDAPKEVQEPIRKLLSKDVVQVLDKENKPVLELWLLEALNTKAKEEQIEKGLRYDHLAETSVFGVIRLSKTFLDYRAQKLKPGVYTLRLGAQPMDGDHMGTAPYNSFVLFCRAQDDKTAGSMDPEDLHEMSAKATGAHPGVFLLFPGKEAAEAPKIATKLGDHQVLFYLQKAKAGAKTGSMGIGLTIVGISSSA